MRFGGRGRALYAPSPQEATGCCQIASGARRRFVRISCTPSVHFELLSLGRLSCHEPLHCSQPAAQRSNGLTRRPASSAALCVHAARRHRARAAPKQGRALTPQDPGSNLRHEPAHWSAGDDVSTVLHAHRQPEAASRCCPPPQRACISRVVHKRMACPHAVAPERRLETPSAYAARAPHACKASPWLHSRSAMLPRVHDWPWAAPHAPFANAFAAVAERPVAHHMCSA